jgi:hypothetical protein
MSRIRHTVPGYFLKIGFYYNFLGFYYKVPGVITIRIEWIYLGYISDSIFLRIIFIWIGIVKKC